MVVLSLWLLMDGWVAGSSEEGQSQGAPPFHLGASSFHQFYNNNAICHDFTGPRMAPEILKRVCSVSIAVAS